MCLTCTHKTHDEIVEVEIYLCLLPCIVKNKRASLRDV